MKKWLAPFAVILIAGAAFYLLFHTPERTVRRAPEISRPTASSEKNEPAETLPGIRLERITATTSPAQSNIAAETQTATVAALASPLSKAALTRSDPVPEYSGPPAGTVLENLRATFHQYAALFGSNPVGTNPEITRALNGGNPKHVQFVRAEDGLRVNDKGELVDPWGTPFFFHQLSGQEMEIHCAGPDRKMWSADDLVTK